MTQRDGTRLMARAEWQWTTKYSCNVLFFFSFLLTHVFFWFFKFKPYYFYNGTTTPDSRLVEGTAINNEVQEALCLFVEIWTFSHFKNGKKYQNGHCHLLDHDGESKLQVRTRTRMNCRSTKCKLVNNSMKTRTCKVNQSIHVEKTEGITSSKSKLYSWNTNFKTLIKS